MEKVCQQVFTVHKGLDTVESNNLFVKKPVLQILGNHRNKIGCFFFSRVYEIFKGVNKRNKGWGEHEGGHFIFF